MQEFFKAETVCINCKDLSVVYFSQQLFWKTQQQHCCSIFYSRIQSFLLQQNCWQQQRKRAYTFAGFFPFDIGNDARKSAYFLELYFFLAAALQLIYYSNEAIIQPYYMPMHIQSQPRTLFHAKHFYLSRTALQYCYHDYSKAVKPSFQNKIVFIVIIFTVFTPVERKKYFHKFINRKT